MEITADNNLPGNAGTAPIDLSGLVRLKYFDQRDYGDAARAPRGNKTAEHRPITPGREGKPMMQEKIPSHCPTRHAGAEIQCRLGKGSWYLCTGIMTLWRGRGKRGPFWCERAGW